MADRSEKLIDWDAYEWFVFKQCCSMESPPNTIADAFDTSIEFAEETVELVAPPGKHWAIAWRGRFAPVASE
jgi:hypothetical protein